MSSNKAVKSLLKKWMNKWMNKCRLNRQMNENSPVQMSKSKMKNPQFNLSTYNHLPLKLGILQWGQRYEVSTERHRLIVVINFVLLLTEIYFPNHAFPTYNIMSHYQHSHSVFIFCNKHFSVSTCELWTSPQIITIKIMTSIDSCRPLHFNLNADKNETNFNTDSINDQK